jgi:hypothetical protein
MVASLVARFPFNPSAGGRKLTGPELDRLETLVRTSPGKTVHQLMLDEMRTVAGQTDIIDGLEQNLTNATTDSDKAAARLEIRETYARLLPQGKHAGPNARILEQARSMGIVK